jgi:hypothetical protein
VGRDPGELEDPELDRAIAGEVSARAADHRDWEADAAGYRGKLDRLQAAESALLARFTRGMAGDAAGAARCERLYVGRCLHGESYTYLWLRK